MNFFTHLEATLGYNMPIIAEDLGEIDQSVIDLRDKFGFPGMKILQFGFETVYVIREHMIMIQHLAGIRSVMNNPAINLEDTIIQMVEMCAGR